MRMILRRQGFEFKDRILKGWYLEKISGNKAMWHSDTDRRIIRYRDKQRREPLLAGEQIRLAGGGRNKVVMELEKRFS